MKEYKIIINGQEKIWNKDYLSYGQVIELVTKSKKTFTLDFVRSFTVTYYVKLTNNGDITQSGTLTYGSAVKVINGMAITAVITSGA